MGLSSSKISCYFFSPSVARKNLKSSRNSCPSPFLSITLRRHPTSSFEISLWKPAINRSMSSPVMDSPLELIIEKIWAASKSNELSKVWCSSMSLSEYRHTCCIGWLFLRGTSQWSTLSFALVSHVGLGWWLASSSWNTWVLDSGWAEWSFETWIYSNLLPQTDCFLLLDDIDPPEEHLELTALEFHILLVEEILNIPLYNVPLPRCIKPMKQRSRCKVFLLC